MKSDLRMHTNFYWTSSLPCVEPDWQKKGDKYTCYLIL